jgi:hypothetical protein
MKSLSLVALLADISISPSNAIYSHHQRNTNGVRVSKNGYTARGTCCQIGRPQRGTPHTHSFHADNLSTDDLNDNVSLVSYESNYRCVCWNNVSLPTADNTPSVLDTDECASGFIRATTQTHSKVRVAGGNLFVRTVVSSPS